jgi:hypothetical protein
VVLLVVAGVAWIVGSRMQRMQLPVKQAESIKSVEQTQSLATKPEDAQPSLNMGKQNYQKEKENNTCPENKETPDNMWTDEDAEYYVKFGSADDSSDCEFRGDVIKGGVIEGLQKSEDKINWKKIDYWNGENDDLYRFKNCNNIKYGGSELFLEVSKDNGKTWIKDYDGYWTGYNKTMWDMSSNLEMKFCRFALGMGQVWVEPASCAN